MSSKKEDLSSPPPIEVVDLTTSEEEITVTAEIREERGDLDVSLQGQDLYISFGPWGGGTVVHLPHPVHASLARATYRNGILDIVLPRQKSGENRTSSPREKSRFR